MVKILEIVEELDAVSDSDDNCLEIDPAEFARKVELKDSDDVVVATKGQIKVEPKDFAKTCDGFNSFDAKCRDYAPGDRKNDPYEIDEDETALHKMDNEDDKSVLEKIIPDMIPVKCEPEDTLGEEDAYDHLPEINGVSHELNPKPKVIDEDEDDYVLVVREAP